MSLNKRVYELVSKIPAGKVTTYGDLAKAVGKPESARVIGQILNRNPNPVIVPCHRVVKWDGKIGGYAYGSSKKIKLLSKEGLRISNGRIINFDKVNFKC